MSIFRVFGRRGVLIIAVGLVCVVGAEAQWRGRYREGSFAARYAPPRMPDADFTICRLEYTRVVIEDRVSAGRPTTVFGAQSDDAAIELTKRGSAATRTTSQHGSSVQTTPSFSNAPTSWRQTRATLV